MTNLQSQTYQVQWEITDNFCPRIIVIDGLLLCGSRIGHSHLFVNKLWLPSSSQLISSKSNSENELIESVVIENRSKLGGVEPKAFECDFC
jgi:hypothetical protein